MEESSVARSTHFPAEKPVLLGGPTLINVILSNGEVRNPTTALSSP